MNGKRRFGLALLNACGLLALFGAMLACSGATTQPVASKPAAVAPVQPVAKEPEQIPVGSPVMVKTKGKDYLAWAVDNQFTYDRLLTFIDADDRQGQDDLIKTGRAAQLEDGVRAKLISYRNGDFLEIRVQTGPEKGKLWLIKAGNIVDNRTKEGD